MLTIAFALLSRFEFETGAGYAIATQLAFVPMLFVLPPEIAPALVAAGRVRSGLPEFLRASSQAIASSAALSTRGTRSARAVVLTAAGVDHGAHWGDWPWWMLALRRAARARPRRSPVAARVLRDRASPRRSTCASSCRPGRWTSCSARSAWLAALASEQNGSFAFALVFPLALLMWVFAQERRARLDQQIETSRTYRRTALLLGELIGEDDEYTGAHSQGVVSLSVAIADELGLGEEQRRLVEFGALLHDVGKIGVPKEIVNKPGALSDEEWDVMRRHTVVGQRMLDRVGGALQGVGEVVRASHERWDGTGYPGRARRRGRSRSRRASSPRRTRSAP